MSMIGQTWYRCIGRSWHEEYKEVEHKLILVEYKVVKEMPATVLLVAERDVHLWNSDWCDWVKEYRVLKEARKRFAYPTKALALESFKHRLSWRIWHLERQLEDARAYQLGFAVVQGLISK